MPHSFVADVDPALAQQVLDIAKRKWKSNLRHDRQADVSAKAAVGLWALWETDYTDLLFETVADLSQPDRGFYEGLYENGNGYIPLQTANNNGVILAALLYKVQGPILQHVNQNTQVWDTAFIGTGTCQRL